eukprot:287920_1
MCSSMFHFKRMFLLEMKYCASVLAFMTIMVCIESMPPYCLPSDTHCWPTEPEITTFASKLNGALVTNTSSDYMHYIDFTEDALYRNRHPSFIIICSNIEDIQQSVSFASFHNIQISIISTGHSCSGRNTANFSLQINLSQLRNYKINKNANNEMKSITVESGLQWGSIYNLVAPNLIVGASDLSVGPSGYSLRGGHSAISPRYGLASDFTLEYFIVDANADIIRIYNTSGINKTIDDLFWSLKGGGGSTFGVIVNMTYEIHLAEPNSVITSLVCDYPFYSDPIKKKIYIGDIIFNNLWKVIQTGQLDSKWGGYLLSMSGNSLIIDINFYGNATFAMTNAQSLFNLSHIGGCKNFTIYETFEEYTSTFASSTGGQYSQMWNDLIPKENLTVEYTNALSAFFNDTRLSNYYLTVMSGVFQGGNVNSFSDNYTAVTPGFRHNEFEMSFVITWTDAKYTNIAINHANKWENVFRKFGIGKYSNEENYECGNPECNWKQQFYGESHYEKLLKVKQKWDPNQVFWCYHCVGSDQSI